MIWHENVQVVFMLCCIKENGKVKCDQYWPPEIDQSFNFELSNFVVTLISVESLMPNLIKRRIRIQNTEVIFILFNYLDRWR